VLVTGASSGIGAALAEGFAERGAVVGICARRATELADVLAACQAHSPDSRSWTIDLSRLDEVEAFAHQADDELGGIDVLVNNAGIPKRRRVDDLTIAEVDEVMGINYLSPVRLTMALLPRMLERGGGRILNIGSVAARLSPPGEAAYAATKAALTAFSECLAVELAGTTVQVHVIHPGVIDTPLFHLPGNDPLLAPVAAEPTAVVVDAVVDQLDTGDFERFVPTYFGDLASGKGADVNGFLAGSAEWYQQARAEAPEAAG
jgi:NAD(P)-dependent dehydrogenase (short-subunit alcohol dehydrogenase family)